MRRVSITVYSSSGCLFEILQGRRGLTFLLLSSPAEGRWYIMPHLFPSSCLSVLIWYLQATVTVCQPADAPASSPEVNWSGSHWTDATVQSSSYGLLCYCFTVTFFLKSWCEMVHLHKCCQNGWLLGSVNVCVGMWKMNAVLSECILLRLSTYQQNGKSWNVALTLCSRCFHFLFTRL